MKIFVVDDSKPFRDHLIELLNEHPNLEVVGQADNSISALKHTSISNADAVIVDICMPGESGIDLLKKLKQNHPSIVVVMYTNSPFDQYRERCQALGADLFFEKLMDVKIVMEAILGLTRVRKINQT